jgi:sugar lactone lactonase YvrE
MKSREILTIAFCVVGSTFALAQTEAPRLPPAPANPPAPSLQSANDPGYAALIAMCKSQPPARGGRAGAGGARGGGRGPQAPQGPREYTVTAIPGVVAAGEKWKFVWQEAGNNGDGIVGTNDGGLLLAQNDNSKVVKLDKNGKASVAYSDTHTGGALSISPKGNVFIVERGLHAKIEQLAPQRKLLTDSYNGDPIDCIGGVINDLTADSKGGVYFTMGGLFHADPKGVVTKYGENLGTNGIILSANEKTLYVTNGQTLAAFDVQPDGSLTNQREFAKLEGGGGGDGSTIDAAGRIYVTTNPGVQVISPEGKYLGIIPTPRGIITAAFGGKDKKTLFILARGATLADGSEVANAAQVWKIQLIARGYKGRAK